jgi:uncharacterized protein (DUF2384 family)
MRSAVNKLLPGEHKDIRLDVKDLIVEPDRWLDTPHYLLGNQKPRDLIGTEQEQHLRDLLRAIKYGLYT